MTRALELTGVTKTFGALRAVDALDLAVPHGQICGFIGPSGAGKTTAIRLIMSILFPDSGSVSVLGHPSALDAKDSIGYLPEERGVYRKMRVGAFLHYIGALKGVPADAAETRASQLLARLNLAEVLNKKCEELSKGMLQRVQLVATIINTPDLLILDEPFSGLDPVSVQLLKALVLAEHARGATVLFSTHIMAQAEELCDRVVMIHKGRKVLDEPMAGLRRQYDTRSLHYEPLDPTAEVTSLRRLPGIERVEATSTGAYLVRLMPGTDPATAMRAVTTAVPPARIELARVRLEDVFVRLVAQDTDGSAGALRADLQGLGPAGGAA